MIIDYIAKPFWYNTQTELAVPIVYFEEALLYTPLIINFELRPWEELVNISSEDGNFEKTITY